MFERFTEKAIKVIMLAQEEARRLGHNFVGTEQILLGLIGEGMGLSIKVEDGSKRAKHAVAIHLLRQLEWITPTALEELDEIILQKKVKVLNNDNVKKLEKRILKIENKIYPLAIKKIFN